MIRKIEYIINFTIGFIITLLFISIPFDINDFINDKETYSKVYHLNISEPFWYMDYFDRHIYLIFITIVFYLISYKRYINKENKFVIINRIYVTILIGLVSWFYYEWYLIGFDH